MKRVLCLFFALSFFVVMSRQCQSANQWNAGSATAYPRGTINPSTIDTEISENITNPLTRLLSKYTEGADLVYTSAASVTISAGEVTCSNSAGTIRLMVSNSGSTALTWSDIDTGSEANSTTYYVYAKVDATTDATFGGIISTSSSAPTGETYYLKLGSFYNNSDGDIEQITNDNMLFTPDYDSGWFSTSASTNYTKAHSLSTTPIYSIVLVKGESSGTAFGGEPIVTFPSNVNTGDNGFYWGVDGTNYYIRWKTGAARVFNSSGSGLWLNTSVSVRILGWRY